MSAAARALGQTQPTLGRQITALEEQLGVVLFERVGRSLVLTPSGGELVGHVRAMFDAASRVSLTASGQSQTVDGSVKITASEVIATYTLMPALRRIRAMAPLLDVDVVASDTIQDIQRREADIAIRHVRPEQPELIARLVQEQTARCYASSSYIEARGVPKTLKDLKSHDFVGYGNVPQMLDFLTNIGIDLTEDNFRIGSGSGVVSWKMACEGLGISIMSDDIAAQFPVMKPAPQKVNAGIGPKKRV